MKCGSCRSLLTHSLLFAATTFILGALLVCVSIYMYGLPKQDTSKLKPSTDREDTQKLISVWHWSTHDSRCSALHRDWPEQHYSRRRMMMMMMKEGGGGVYGEECGVFSIYINHLYCRTWCRWWDTAVRNEHWCQTRTLNGGQVYCSGYLIRFPVSFAEGFLNICVSWAWKGSDRSGSPARFNHRANVERCAS